MVNKWQPFAETGSQAANPAGAPLLQLFLGSGTDLRERLAASQAGLLPPQNAFLFENHFVHRSSRPDIDPIDFETKVRHLKYSVQADSAVFRYIPLLQDHALADSRKIH